MKNIGKLGSTLILLTSIASNAETGDVGTKPPSDAQKYEICEIIGFAMANGDTFIMDVAHRLANQRKLFYTNICDLKTQAAVTFFHEKSKSKSYSELAKKLSSYNKFKNKVLDSIIHRSELSDF